jgi:hypothetical protein
MSVILPQAILSCCALGAPTMRHIRAVCQRFLHVGVRVFDVDEQLEGTYPRPPSCNGPSHGVGATVDVGSVTDFNSWVSGHTGVCDLFGNGLEWENSCEATVGKANRCRIRGGTFDGDNDIGGAPSTYRPPAGATRTTPRSGFAAARGAGPVARLS